MVKVRARVEGVEEDDGRVRRFVGVWCWIFVGGVGDCVYWVEI